MHEDLLHGSPVPFIMSRPRGGLSRGFSLEPHTLLMLLIKVIDSNTFLSLATQPMGKLMKTGIS